MSLILSKRHAYVIIDGSGLRRLYQIRKYISQSNCKAIFFNNLSVPVKKKGKLNFSENSLHHK
jgi:hypothetical protein